jgi:hypothetical protein
MSGIVSDSSLSFIVRCTTLQSSLTIASDSFYDEERRTERGEFDSRISIVLFGVKEIVFTFKETRKIDFQVAD